MTLYTIGFTRSTAERFFTRLEANGVVTVRDIRLHTGGQLAGFAKAQDLRYFLERIARIAYVTEPILAPAGEMLHAYRAKRLSWEQYAAQYRVLIESRDAAAQFDATALAGSCLLCSEATAERCHRRLAAEYLAERYAMDVVHL